MTVDEKTIAAKAKILSHRRMTGPMRIIKHAGRYRNAADAKSHYEGIKVYFESHSIFDQGFFTRHHQLERLCFYSGDRPENDAP